MPQMRPGSGRVGEGGWTVPHLDQNLSAAGTDDRSESGSDWVEPVPNMDRSFILLLALCLTCSPVRSQSPGQDSFIIQYLERRLLQMEERLSRCEQNTARLTQTTYDLSSQVRAHRSTVHVLQSEVRSQVDGVSARVDRVERELEYLEKKIPLSSDIQMEEALLEQQIQAAELELIQNRAKLQLQSADCSVALSQIKSLKIVKKTGDVSGSWFKDPTAGSQKIYLLSGVRNHTLLEFGSLQSFSSATPPPRVLQLPASWQGTGHVVYGGFLFYHKADTPNQILKVSLESGGVVDSALLPGAGRLPVYGLNPDTYLHLAVDQLGLWVLHADPDYAGNLILTKLDKAWPWSSRGTRRARAATQREPSSSAGLSTWSTTRVTAGAPPSSASTTSTTPLAGEWKGQAPLVSPRSKLSPLCSGETPVRFFPKRYTSHSSLSYHPGDQQLFTWDDGYQTVYQVETRRNLAQPAGG
ncbi:olfactomedin-like protein 3 isoform X6 [Synchiropus splendidus]|uniref:olfactomedin-like protein 3 isoform X6 n=1 Tax=Synchiropus splendidus TaxID=270530 RepID=UPI00237EB2D6|nr:olfactomedin-like protein 3 isoform X6 [Synchiropus splendidus]